MTGRLCLLAAVVATAVVQCLPVLPGQMAMASLVTGVAGASLLAYGYRSAFMHRLGATASVRLLMFIWVVVLALCITVLRAQHRLDDRLAPGNENKVSRVVLRIAGLVEADPGTRRFEADVVSSKPAGVPSRILVSWHAGKWGGPYGRFTGKPAHFPDLAPGQVWRMALTLKTPHGARNPYGFDYEGYLFARGIRATASVRGTPRYIRDEPWANLPIVAQRARHVVRQAMHPYVGDKRFGAVLLALAIGDQDSVQAQDWQVFNLTGITHLVSISGSHITMIAALAAIVVSWLWPRLRFWGRPLAERVPAQVASALAALAVAWIYCLLAGWGVPARRTFVMLLVLACARVARLSLSTSRALCLVVFAVVVLDPWALLASGFWLSFGAVYVLLASAGWISRDMVVQHVSPWRRIKRYLWAAIRIQLAISVALTPLLALIFHQVSVVSPLANAYAIPVIGLIVTPLSLLAAATSFVPGLGGLTAGFVWLAHESLALIMVPTAWLAELGVASINVAAAPWWLFLLAVTGLVVASTPYGFPGRTAAWLLVVPALCWRPDQPKTGGWYLAALDVGQSGAIVVRTSDHTVLFDTGLRRGPESDEAARTILPHLWATGVDRVDVLVVSHADIDHAGGVRSILSAMPVGQSYSSFDLLAYLRREARFLGKKNNLPALPPAMSACVAGVSWKIDGVSFRFVWPAPAVARKSDKRRSGRGNRRNDKACVLLVQGVHHSALLTADIGIAQEARLLDSGIANVDVVMAGHHGSRTSSGRSFVRAMSARHVIAQVGKWNRYGHPNTNVVRRWERAGAKFWRSDEHGAVLVRSGDSGLHVESVRKRYRRYWHS